MPSLQVPGRRSLGDVLHSAAVPFLFFAAVLCGLLLLSWVLLLPVLTRVEVAGHEGGAPELIAFKGALVASIQQLEEQRDEYLLPGGEGFPEEVLARRQIQSEVASVREAVLSVSERVVPETNYVIAFQSLSYDAAQRSLVLTGRVQNVGPASMTVLAQFVSALKALPVVASVAPPRYVREQAEDGSFSSPFVITLTLQ